MRLAVVTLGHVHAAELEALTRSFDHLEQLILDVAPRTALVDVRPELNRAVDAATGDWILVVRERETIDDALAHEISAATAAGNAWGFRIRSQVLYAGAPLHIGDRPDGELRLFHRRHLLRRGDPAVEGTVVRLAAPLRSMSFASSDDHRSQLARTGVPHSWLRRVLLFLRYAGAAGTLDRNTLRYLWIEAAFDQG